jgi:hypothetical protein
MADEDFFRSCINAFISAARSITMVMERESKKNPELWAWYKSQTERFAGDAVMQFFNEQRVLTIHRGNVKPKAQHIPLQNKAVAEANHGTVSIWVFDNVNASVPDETGNVLRMCDDYLQSLERMVIEWRYLKAVSEDPRDVIDRLQVQSSRLRGEILGLRSELDQAKLTLELLNDILKNKGDHSQDEWVNQLSVRISRMLNPEYFQKAPGVKPKGAVARNKTGSLKLYTILVSPTEAQSGSEGVYATIRNDYAKDDTGDSVFDKEFGYALWGTNLKGPLPHNEIIGFSSAIEAERAALAVYKILRY